MLKLKDVYLEAARMVAEKEQEYSCHAVAEIADPAHFVIISSGDIPHVQRYCRVFGPNGQYMGFCSAVMNPYHYSNRRRNWTKERNLRVMMLCLMAECWKDFK